MSVGTSATKDDDAHICRPSARDRPSELVVEPTLSASMSSSCNPRPQFQHVRDSQRTSRRCRI
ncbi:hypothetical protein BDV10DRAFT_173166 [Aspergillus recurvatus]